MGILLVILGLVLSLGGGAVFVYSGYITDDFAWRTLGTDAFRNAESISVTVSSVVVIIGIVLLFVGLLIIFKKHDAPPGHTAQTDVRKLCILAMMSTLAFILAAYVRVPVIPVPPLRYDPKDIIIVISGFIYGPLAAFAVTVVVSFVQMFTVSATGFIGLFMNIVASTAFCCTAALIYKKNRTMKGAIIGLIVGTIFATAVMLLWNYILTPIFINRPREQVVPMLIPVFLPFNLISNSLNAALTVMLYRHVKPILRAARIMPVPAEDTGKKKINVGIIIAAGFVILTCVIWWLILQDVL